MLCIAFLPMPSAHAEEVSQKPDRNLQPPSEIDPTLDPCRHFTSDEPMVGFFIGMEHEDRLVPMRVPKRYLEDRFDHQEGAVHGAQLFRIEVPTFEPITRAETGRRNAANLPWDWMNFIVKDQLPLDQTAGLQLLTLGLPFGDPRRIEERLNPPHPRDFPSEKGPYGLTRVIAPDRLEGEDLFVHYNADGNLAGWMRCSVKGVGSTRNAGCDHTTRLSTMDVSIGYLRTELPNWEVIYDNVAKFLTCATTNNI